MSRISRFVMKNLMAGQKSPEAYLLGDINMDGAIDVNDVKAVNARLQPQGGLVRRRHHELRVGQSTS